MTPADDITPEEIDEMEASAGLHVAQEVIDLAADQMRLLAALRRSDAEIERQKRVVEALSVYSAEAEDERDAAKALLARAVQMLRDVPEFRGDAYEPMWESARKMLLAEIEVDHGG